MDNLLRLSFLPVFSGLECVLVYFLTAIGSPVMRNTMLLQTDGQLSVLGSPDTGHRSFTSHGHFPSDSAPWQAFAGEHLDDASKGYLLGNGHRAYRPDLMRFLSPDRMSPFGAGGVNAYAYCSGDPVNNIDPSGRWLLPLARISGAVAYTLGSAALLGTVAYKNRGQKVYTGLFFAEAAIAVAGIVSLFVAPEEEEIGLSLISAANLVAIGSVGVKTLPKLYRHRSELGSWVGGNARSFFRSPRRPHDNIEMIRFGESVGNRQIRHSLTGQN